MLVTRFSVYLYHSWIRNLQNSGWLWYLPTFWWFWFCYQLRGLFTGNLIQKWFLWRGKFLHEVYLTTKKLYYVDNLVRVVLEATQFCFNIVKSYNKTRSRFLLLTCLSRTVDILRIFKYSKHWSERSQEVRWTMPAPARLNKYKNLI